mgnify:CR=1 FL=1|tara:strand:- start:2689 stop:5007 length:2319 start_codon:yes stop_codon:yes gene_type:complete
MKRAILSTKAKTLSSLKNILKNAEVLPLFCFSIKDWTKNNKSVIEKINSYFGKNVSKIIRSSSTKEDNSSLSFAGYFTSETNIITNEDLVKAIENVIISYGKNVDSSEEVLVQPMLKNSRMSGVAFNHDPSTGSAYKVINYTIGSNTSGVTSGAAKTKTFVYFENKKNSNQDINKVANLIEELENLFPKIPLDIEFAFSDKNKLYLFQVRPLIINKTLGDQKTHNSLLESIKNKISLGQKEHPFLLGKTTLYGVMPDWNPAEIIGIRPRPLALSLYRDLITDSIWAYQRDNYGYMNLRSFPLMVDFGGKPYVDVRISFNSFVPKDIDPKLANRLVDYYLNKLISLPKLHDKIEYEIVFSCYTFDLKNRLEALKEENFSSKDLDQISNSLKNLTNKIIDTENGLWRVDQRKLKMLESRRMKIKSSNMDKPSKIYWLLEDIKRYGTLPFAGLARAGFISVQFLKSLVSVGIFSQDDYDKFMNSLNTVAKKLSHHINSLSQKDFLLKYGHLRPGTYDILSERYDEAPEKYFGNLISKQKENKSYNFKLRDDQKIKIEKLLKEHKISANVDSLFEFLKSGIELREFAKFEFSKNLSDAIKIFQEWGESLGFTREDLSYSNVNCIKEAYVCADNSKKTLSQSIAQGKKSYEATKKLWLPSLILKPEDSFSFHLPETEPNFVTQNTVSGKVVNTTEKEKLNGNIVFIESADPGYDWLFTYPIAGLVTAYGGVNSHMAIRANELNLPAVIGAGEELFRTWTNMNEIRIDCAARRVEIIS